MKKEVTIIYIFLFIITVAIAVFFIFQNPQKLSPSDSLVENTTAQKASPLSPARENMYEIALARARQWKSDAELAYMTTNAESSFMAPLEEFNFIFTSAMLFDTGFFVAIRDGKIASATERAYVSAPRTPFPSKAISLEKAIEYVQHMVGYEDVKIYGVEAVYGKTGEVWYWGVKTDKGTISVEAR